MDAKGELPRIPQGAGLPWLTSGLLGTPATASWGSGTLPYTYAFTGAP